MSIGTDAGTVIDSVAGNSAVPAGAVSDLLPVPEPPMETCTIGTRDGIVPGAEIEKVLRGPCATSEVLPNAKLAMETLAPNVVAGADPGTKAAVLSVCT
jgi:hypothetical protein